MRVLVFFVIFLAGTGLGVALMKVHFPGKPNAVHWKWADSLDAVKAAPNSHHVLFENDSVRILEVTLQPYMQEPMHVHRWPGVMFGNNNGDTSSFDIVYYRYDYDPVKHQYFVKDSIRQHQSGSTGDGPDNAAIMKPEGPHSVKNLSDVKIDVYRIEFK